MEHLANLLLVQLFADVVTEELNHVAHGLDRCMPVLVVISRRGALHDVQELLPLAFWHLNCSDDTQADASSLQHISVFVLKHVKECFLDLTAQLFS